MGRHIPQEATQAAQNHQLAAVLGLLDNTALPAAERASALRATLKAPPQDDLAALRQALWATSTPPANPSTKPPRR